MRKHGRKLAPGLCLAFLLLPLIFFLTFLAGCGGGGSSGGGVAGPAATSMITGRVIAPDELLQRLNLMSASSAAAGPRATVWLENNPDDMQLTDSSGNFSFSGLAPGVAYRVVCRYDIAATGELYLVRSGEILIAATAQAGQTGDLTLEKGKYTISGILRNQFNQPVANARMSLWGIRFKTLSDGTFITPPMPESAATEKINVQADGYRQMTLELPFIHSQDMMPGIDVTLSDVSEPNFAPLLFFKQAPQKVAPGEKIALQIAVFDPMNWHRKVLSRSGSLFLAQLKRLLTASLFSGPRRRFLAWPLSVSVLPTAGALPALQRSVLQLVVTATRLSASIQ